MQTIIRLTDQRNVKISSFTKVLLLNIVIILLGTSLFSIVENDAHGGIHMMIIVFLYAILILVNGMMYMAFRNYKTGIIYGNFSLFYLILGLVFYLITKFI